MFRGQSAAGAHLRLIPLRKGDEKPRGNQRALERSECQGRFEAGFEVHAGRERRRIERRRKAGLVDDFHFQHVVHFVILSLSFTLSF